MRSLPFYTLEELSKKHSVVLLDSCGVLGTFKEFHIDPIEKIERATETIDFFMRHLKRTENVYLTREIFHELEGFKFHRTRLEELAEEEIKKFLEIKELFLNEFEEESNILALSKKERNLLKGLKNKYFGSIYRYGMSREDYDLIMSALTYSNYHGGVGVITNDKGIINFSRYLLTQRTQRNGIGIYNHEILGTFVPAIDFVKPNKKPETVRRLARKNNNTY